MTYTAVTKPTARKKHLCQMCARGIQRGETYYRYAVLDITAAYTYKYCEHCVYVTEAYCRVWGDREDVYDEHVIEWALDEHPEWISQMQAGWRYPDGELLPPPWQPRCYDCSAEVSLSDLWCLICDERRVAKISKQLKDLRMEAV